MTNQPAPSDTPREFTIEELGGLLCLYWGSGDYIWGFAPSDRRIAERLCEELNKKAARLSAEREKEIPAFPQTTEDPVAVAVIARLTATLAERDRQLAEAKAEIESLKDQYRDTKNACDLFASDNVALQAQLDASERQRKEMEVFVHHMANRSCNCQTSGPDVDNNRHNDSCMVGRAQKHIGIKVESKPIYNSLRQYTQTEERK